MRARARACVFAKEIENIIRNPDGPSIVERGDFHTRQRITRARLTYCEWLFLFRQCVINHDNNMPRDAREKRITSSPTFPYRA